MRVIKVLGGKQLKQANERVRDDASWRWTVDGVSPAAQDAARNAARRAKVSLGEWLEGTIIRVVERGSKSGETADPRPARRYF